MLRSYHFVTVIIMLYEILELFIRVYSFIVLFQTKSALYYKGKEKHVCGFEEGTVTFGEFQFRLKFY